MQIWVRKTNEIEQPNQRVAVILAGGLGMRLRSVVSDVPKPMADIDGRPFLDYLVNRLISHGINHVVLCVSYLKEKVIDYFSPRYPGLVSFSIEDRPMGTAGALKRAERHLTDRFLVLNGDSFTPVNYRALVSFHGSKRADITLTLVKKEGSRFGRVTLEADRISSFIEKGVGNNGYVNAGVYLMERSVLNRIPTGKPYSIENQLLPSLLGEGARLVGFVTPDDLIDIGLPETYACLRRNAHLLLT